MLKHILFIITIVGFAFSCQSPQKKTQKLQVVTTTTMLTDLVKNIGKDSITVVGLMGAGVDPHLYKASEGDVSKITQADAIFYNGLHLEGKMAEVLENLKKSGKKTYAVADAIPKEELISSENFSNTYDPHIWFSIQNWKKATHYVTQKLIELSPKHTTYFQENARIYQVKLDELSQNVQQQIALLPKEERILVTAHDAFSYFGKEFDFQVIGLQGISTATEAGTKDVIDLADFIAKKKIPAIFLESSVPKQTIEALQNAVESKNHHVMLGGTLYSDALGSTGTAEGTYIGMFNANVTTILNALQSNPQQEDNANSHTGR